MINRNSALLMLFAILFSAICFAEKNDDLKSRVVFEKGISVKNWEKLFFEPIEKIDEAMKKKDSKKRMTAPKKPGKPGKKKKKIPSLLKTKNAPRPSSEDSKPLTPPENNSKLSLPEKLPKTDPDRDINTPKIEKTVPDSDIPKKEAENRDEKSVMSTPTEDTENPDRDNYATSEEKKIEAPLRKKIKKIKSKKKKWRIKDHKVGY